MIVCDVSSLVKKVSFAVVVGFSMEFLERFLHWFIPIYE
jgi:hypothetical protein